LRAPILKGDETARLQKGSVKACPMENGSNPSLPTIFIKKQWMSFFVSTVSNLVKIKIQKHNMK